MKRLLFKATLILLAIAGYIASPFVTAWSIREAVRNGDSAYLESRIDWPGVRASLAPTIGRLALNLPDPDAAPLTKPGVWQRFKAYFGQGAINRALDSYITPEGLPQLFAARKAYRKYISGEPEDSALPVMDRMKRFWARVKRAEFKTMTEFEIDVVDKHDPDRLYLGKLVIDGFGWKLKELRVKTLITAEEQVQRLAAAVPVAAASAQPAAAPAGLPARANSRRGSGGFISSAEASEPIEPPARTAGKYAAGKAPGLWTRISTSMRQGDLWARAKAAAR